MADGIRWKSASAPPLDLRDARRLGSCCTEVTTPHGAQVVLRTDRAPSAGHAAALAREAVFWTKVAERDAHVLPLLDWGVPTAGGVCFLSPRMKRIIRLDEPRALSVIRQISATIARTRSVHGNLSVETVFFGENDLLMVGGFGGTRLRNLDDGATEADDVQALANILYFLLAGKEYAGGKLRLDKSVISGETRRLLRRALDGEKDVSLLEFRYDIGAAMGELPVCTRALPPSEPKQRKDTLLRADLNSVNGSNSRREAEGLSLIPAQAPVVAPRRRSNGDAARYAGGATPAAAATTTMVGAAAVLEPKAIPLAALRSVDDLVSSLVAPDLDAMDSDKLKGIVQQCISQPATVDEMFKVLFKHPLSKDPVVAFKSLILLHTLLREGPAEATTRAVTHDEFLRWVEASWSRERIQSRPPQKAHRLSHCFAVGELGWYASFLRRRAAFFSAYTVVFSPRWTVRAGALHHTAENNRALRVALSVLEGAVGILKRAASSSDPAALVKKGAILPLVTDIAYAYRACCWLYATAPAVSKTAMEEDLDAAHHATRSVFRTVATNPTVVANLPPQIVLRLDETPPRNIDGNVLMKAMQALSAPSAKSNGRKKKPRRTQNDVKAETENEQSLDAEESERRDSAVLADGQDRALNEKELTDTSKTNGKSKKKKKKKAATEDIKQTEIEEPHNPTEERALPERSIGLSNHNAKVLQEVEREDPSAVSNQGNAVLNEVDGEAHLGGKGGRRTNRVRKSKKRSNRRKEESNRSHPQESDGSSTENSIGDDSDVSSDESPESDAPPVKSSKKVSRRHRSEKDIPFDKEHPKRKPAVPAKATGTRQTAITTNSSTENREGSKEALAAAASGKKTPHINPSFEVAPYEVQFGPQIGSGGFGVVHKAKFRGQTVAVKKIHSHALSNVASISEFQSEVAVLCTLKHPNILAFMGACTKPPNLMIITEFMERGTLFDVLHQSQLRITWPMRRKFALDTCRGMRYLHDSKLLHRDLKSSNLMLDKDFNCKVGDFGLTRTSSGTAAVQMTGQCGTFQYMAVEVLANKPYSEKADVFSFGILLWEMVARKLPYFGMQPMQVGIAVVQKGMRPTIPPKTPAPLLKLMRSCWDSDPHRRPSFALLVEMLEAMPQ